MARKWINFPTGITSENEFVQRVHVTETDLRLAVVDLLNMAGLEPSEITRDSLLRAIADFVEATVGIADYTTQEYAAALDMAGSEFKSAAYTMENFREHAGPELWNDVQRVMEHLFSFDNGEPETPTTTYKCVIKRRGSGSLIQRATEGTPARIIHTLLRELAMTFPTREDAQIFLNTTVPNHLRELYKIERTYPKGQYSCCGAKVGESHAATCSLFPKS